MDHQCLQSTIAELDDAVPRAGARVKFEQYGGGPDESHVIANREGFLRLGVEFLKAAYAPAGIAHSRDAVPVELNYLVSEDSTVNFDWFERREPDAPAMLDAGGYLIPVIIVGMFVSLFALAAVGLYTVANWLGLP
jgi:hypothetical protein